MFIHPVEGEVTIGSIKMYVSNLTPYYVLHNGYNSHLSAHCIIAILITSEKFVRGVLFLGLVL